MAEHILYEFLVGGRWWDFKTTGEGFAYRPTNGKAVWRRGFPDGLTSKDIDLIRAELRETKAKTLVMP